MELSKYLRDYSRTVAGKEQLIIASVAKSLEIIPRQLCDNAGFDSTNILNKLRERHAQGMVLFGKGSTNEKRTLYGVGHKWYGVDITKEDVMDTFEAFVWEPAMVKLNALTAAAEAAALILSVDETIKNPRSGANQPTAALPGMGRGRGRPM